MSSPSWVESAYFVVISNTLSLAGILGVLALFIWSQKSRTLYPLPPGPKPVFALGNIRDLTGKELWLQVRKWVKEYGALFVVTITSV
jgi:hypothetical protein